MPLQFNETAPGAHIAEYVSDDNTRNAALHFRARHEQSAVRFSADSVRQGCCKTGLTGFGIEFVTGIVER